MPNRSIHTYAREGRRCRLWLKSETWRLLELRASEIGWDGTVSHAIEVELDKWADRVLNPPALLGQYDRTGPVELERANPS